MAKQKTTSIESVKKARAALEKVHPKKSDEIPLPAAISELSDVIEGAIKKGYSREEIVGILNKNGVDAKAYQLKTKVSKKKSTP